MDKYNLEMKMTDYRPVHPSSGYIEATNRYAGKAKKVNNGNNVRKKGLVGHVAGLPFPKPKDGLEVAWNRNYAYGGDDRELSYAIQLISAARGVEHTEEWLFNTLKTIARTDVEPIPEIAMFKKQDVARAGLTYCMSPPDKKGFGAVYKTSDEPIDGQGHIYVPAMRRVLRNAYGTRGEAWNSTDMFYEDVYGYLGAPEWMNWKIISKGTKFVPVHAAIKTGKKNMDKTFDNKNWPHWNIKAKWEPRPTYVLEVKPKLKDYPYSKQYMYVDAETYIIHYKEAYDRKGDLWKIMIIASNESEDEDEYPLAAGGQVIVDVQSEHGTTFHIYNEKLNTDIKQNQFTLTELRKRGR
jgi:hypothetical protein